MKKILLFSSCYLYLLLLTSCASYYAEPGIYNLSPQKNKVEIQKIDSITGDSTEMLLSVKNELYKKRKAQSPDNTPKKVYNFISTHVGLGSIRVSNNQYNQSGNIAITTHLDYEHYYRDTKGFGLGLFYMLYQEQEKNDLNKKKQNLYLHTFGPQMLYKIRWNRVILGAGAGFAGALIDCNVSHASKEIYSGYTLGTGYTLRIGMEILLNNILSLSFKYNHSGTYFSDKDFFTGNGKVSIYRNALLIGFGYYF